MGTKEVRKRLRNLYIEENRTVIESKEYIYTKKLRQPTWAVGMTVAFRLIPTVCKTVESLASAGWTDPILFAEPNSNSIPSNVLVHWNEEVLGNWYNFCRRLKYMARMRADKYLLVQDDVEFLPGTRQWVEDNWPCNDGVVSLYRSAQYSRLGGTEESNKTYDVLTYGKMLLGALAIVMSQEHVESVLLNLEAMFDGNICQDDIKLGKLLHAIRVPINIVRKSRCQHIGETSSVYPHSKRITNSRRADTYVK